MIDNHTHSPRPDAVIDLDPCSMPLGVLSLRPDMLYSIGIHPWNVGLVTPDDLRWVRALAVDPRVVAIGETGLDAVHVSYGWNPVGGDAYETQPDLEAQRQLLDFHIRLSEEVRKPLLLHIVKCYPEILRLRLKMRPAPRQPWIIHGFRGKPGLAADLLKAGFYLSYGEKFNPLSVAVTPPDRLLVETDESWLPVAEIARRLGVRPSVTLPALCARSQGVAP